MTTLTWRNILVICSWCQRQLHHQMWTWDQTTRFFPDPGKDSHHRHGIHNSVIPSWKKYRYDNRQKNYHWIECPKCYSRSNFKKRKRRTGIICKKITQKLRSWQTTLQLKDGLEKSYQQQLDIVVHPYKLKGHTHFSMKDLGTATDSRIYIQ
jgi:hypothetical protein